MPIYEEKEKVNGQKRWFVRTYITDENGNKKQITRHNKEWIGRDGYWEAFHEENRLKNTIITVKIQNNITFKDLFLLKMQHDELQNKNSESTRITYNENLKIHVFPIIGNINIYKLTRADLEKIIFHLKNYEISKGKNKGKKLSLKFINEIINTTKSIIQFGIDYYDIKKTILQYLPNIEKNRDEITKIEPIELLKKQTIISPTEWTSITNAMEEMISNAPKEKKEFITKMMLFFTTEYILLTRVGETQSMTYKNLFFDYKIYILYEAYNKRLKKITPTKNRTERILYIPDSLLNAFERMYKIDSKKKGFNVDWFIFGSEYVFPRSTIDRYRRKLLNLANIRYVTNHELRHAGISNAMHNKADVSALADMAGHDKEIMFNNYLQTLKESNRDLVNILNKLQVPNF